MPNFRGGSSPRPNTFYNAGVLGGQGANSLRYTKAQVGAAAAPNPAPPGATGWVGSNAVPNPRQNQYPDTSHSEDPKYRIVAPARNFRGRGWGAPPDTTYLGPGTLAPSGATTRSGSATLAGHSASNGFADSGQANALHAVAYPVTTQPFFGGTNAVPDKSRQWAGNGDPAGYPLAVGPDAYPVEYMTQNQALAGVGGGGQTPAEWMAKNNKLLSQRPKAGGTSADDYRPARRWVQTPSNRPWDKNGLSYSNRGRHSLPAPLASTPLFYPSAVKGGVPSPGGHGAAPGMRAVGIQTNTARMIPQPWDQNLVNAGSGDNSARIQSSYRARQWKGR